MRAIGVLDPVETVRRKNQQRKCCHQEQRAGESEMTSRVDQTKQRSPRKQQSEKRRQDCQRRARQHVDHPSAMLGSVGRFGYPPID